ncbi:RDD family protein [Streptomyces chryseus]
MNFPSETNPYSYPHQHGRNAQAGFPHHLSHGGYAQPGQPPLGGIAYPSGYATWGARAIARLVDGGIAAAPAVVLAGTGGLLLARNNTFGWYLIVVGYVATLAIQLSLIRQKGIRGQSLGQKKAKICLIHENNHRPIGFGKAILREVAHMVDSLACYMGWLMPLFDSKRQTIADKLMGTIVVRVG